MVGYHTVSVQFSCVESPKIRRSRHISQQQGRKNAFRVSMFWTKRLISSSSHETTMPHEGVIFRHNAEIPRHGIFVSCLGIFVSRHGIPSETAEQRISPIDILSLSKYVAPFAPAHFRKKYCATCCILLRVQHVGHVTQNLESLANLWCVNLCPECLPFARARTRAFHRSLHILLSPVTLCSAMCKCADVQMCK